MAVVNPENSRPLWPGVACTACCRGCGLQFEIHHCCALVSQSSPYTVSACVATTNHHHILALCIHKCVRVPSALELPLARLQHLLCVLGEELHGKVHTLQLSAWD